MLNYSAKIFALLILFNSIIFSQQIEHPKFSLTGIKVNISYDLAEDDSIKILTADSEKRLVNEFLFTKNSPRQEIIFNNAGSYSFYIDGEEKSISTIRIIPGWFSLIPPVLAIFLALVIRQVIVSLAAGIYVGAFFIYDYDPFIAFLRFADSIVLNSLTDPDHMFVITFTLLIGGVVGIITKNGGTAGLANIITKLAKTARSGMIASWLMGLAVFFDDYANSLIIGNMMRPITDKLRISREKLAYIVDSTAAPIASVVIISTWIGYELGLIGEGLKIIGSTENAYDVFISTIPYRFYPIAALFFVFATSYFQRDFGPMYRAEKRARLTGKLFETLSSEAKTVSEDELGIGKAKPKWYNAAVPILMILFGTVAGLIYTGITKLEEIGSSNYSIQNIISNSDSYSALLWASLLACFIAIVMTVWQGIQSLSDVINSWYKGVQSMLLACIILVLAWSISNVTTELMTADYLISIVSDAINPRFLPVIVFIVCAFISFATGTSWGTMAIVMPIVIPLASLLSDNFGFAGDDKIIIIHGVISSVLTGSVFGDHCSPIADTTILSSIASKCNHIDHVRTQLPYAMLVGIICMAAGDIPTAFGFSPYFSLVIIFGVLITFLFVFGKKLPEVPQKRMSRID